MVTVLKHDFLCDWREEEMSRNKRLYWLSRIHTFYDKYCFMLVGLSTKDPSEKIFIHTRLGSLLPGTHFPLNSSSSIWKLLRIKDLRDKEMKHALGWQNINPSEVLCGALIYFLCFSVPLTLFVRYLIATWTCFDISSHPKNTFIQENGLDTTLRPRCNFFLLRH